MEFTTRQKSLILSGLRAEVANLDRAREDLQKRSLLDASNKIKIESRRTEVVDLIWVIEHDMGMIKGI